MAAPVAAALPCATTQSRLSPATAGPKTELGHLESPSGSEWGGLPQRSQGGMQIGRRGLLATAWVC